MSKKDELRIQEYWLDIEIRSFISNVWDQGLQKFAEDSMEEVAVLELDLSRIKLSPLPGEEATIVELISLQEDESSPKLIIKVKLFHFDNPLEIYQILNISDYEEATDYIPKIIYLWSTSGQYRVPGESRKEKE